MRILRARTFVIGAMALTHALPALAQNSLAAFYNGRTVSLIIASAAA